MALREWERALTAGQPLALHTSSVLITASCLHTKPTSERQTSGKKCCSAPMHQWHQIACWIGLFLQAGSSENRPKHIVWLGRESRLHFFFPFSSMHFITVLFLLQVNGVILDRYHLRLWMQWYCEKVHVHHISFFILLLPHRGVPELHERHSVLK